MLTGERLNHLACAMGDCVDIDLVRAAVERRGRAIIPVVGDSMLPAIVPGTCVVVAEAPFAAVSCGDVVAVVIGGRVVVHRVGWRDETHLATVGDNMPLFDPQTANDAFIGVVEGVGPSRSGQPMHKSLPPVGGCSPRLQIVFRAEGFDPELSLRAAKAPTWVTGAGAGSPIEAERFDVNVIKVGVSPSGALTLSALASILMSHPAQTFVGWTFGVRLDPSDRTTLPPSAMDVHVRATSVPHQPSAMSSVVHKLARITRRVEAKVHERD